MDWVDELFVRRFDDLADGLRARDDYERLKVAAGLRQMLLDESPLVHQANRSRRLKLRFRVNKTRDHSHLPVQPDVLFHAHGLDPTVFQVREGTRELKLEQFLALPLVETPQAPISVADLIRYGANKAGGVHLDPARDDSDTRLEAAFGRMAAFGVHALAIALQTITRITLAALRPLRDSIVRLPDLTPGSWSRNYVGPQPSEDLCERVDSPKNRSSRCCRSGTPARRSLISYVGTA